MIYQHTLILKTNRSTPLLSFVSLSSIIHFLLLGYIKPFDQLFKNSFRQTDKSVSIDRIRMYYSSSHSHLTLGCLSAVLCLIAFDLLGKNLRQKLHRIKH